MHSDSVIAYYTIWYAISLHSVPTSYLHYPSRGPTLQKIVYESLKSFFDFIEITLISGDFTDYIEISLISSDFTDLKYL